VHINFDLINGRFHGKVNPLIGIPIQSGSRSGEPRDPLEAEAAWRLFFSIVH